VTLSSGDTADVTAAGKAVFIGKNAGSDNNKLVIKGSLTARQIIVGAAGNTGNVLEAAAAGALAGMSVITVNAGSTLQLSDSSTTDRISNSVTITMAGGAIAFSGNITEGPSAGTGALTLTADSIIDFGGGNDIVNFGASGTGKPESVDRRHHAQHLQLGWLTGRRRQRPVDLRQRSWRGFAHGHATRADQLL
jgi:uncharacterized Zn-binding protein involved in type VI secretion